MMDATDQQGSPQGRQEHKRGAGQDDVHASSIQQALQALDAGRLDEAHKRLTRLLRTHSTDPAVIFPLAVVRYRLGYIVSAEVIFAQAFEHGHVIHDTSTLQAVEGHPLQARWRDPSGEVQLLLSKRPRSRSMRLLKVERPSSAAAAKTPPTSQAAKPASPPTPSDPSASTLAPAPAAAPTTAPTNASAPAVEPAHPSAPSPEPTSDSAPADAAIPLSDR